MATCCATSMAFSSASAVGAARARVGKGSASRLRRRCGVTCPVRSRAVVVAVSAGGGEDPSWTLSGKELERHLDELVAELDEEPQSTSWESSPEYQRFFEANKGRSLFRSDVVHCADAMEFFRHREGEWESWRVSHHLAFRRDETGMSNIKMLCLDSADERIIELCKQHDVDPATSQGGCYVTWAATMAWDQEGDNHEGSTVFALVPEEDDARRGRILRDRGYAEIVPIAGEYYLDDEDALNLVTPYEGGEVIERFWFDGPDQVNRLSSVKRFGGFTNATFATERRSTADAALEAGNVSADASAFGSPRQVEELAAKAPPRFAARQTLYGAAARARQEQLYSQRTGGGAGRASAFGPPSTRSAFGPPSARSAFGAPGARSAFANEGKSGEASGSSGGKADAEIASKGSSDEDVDTSDQKK